MPKNKTTVNPSNGFISAINRPELVFGLIGPIGTDLDSVCRALEQSVSVAGYDTHQIRLSAEIENFYNKKHNGMSEADRIGSLMDLGNELRVKSGTAAAAAVLAILKIFELRNSEKPKTHEDGMPRGQAYILRSLKNPEEVEKLRLVYGKGFIAISVSASRDDRHFSLTERLSKSYLGKKPPSSPESIAKNLIDRDEAEENKLHQNVRDSFPLGDVFVDVSNVANMRAQIRRFLHLTFGNRFLTPSIDEHGMFQAASAALRSSDLNRQVGAAIVRSTGEIISVGCNDVPKAGGDQYWEGDPRDARDFHLGIDSSAEQRESMLSEMLGRLVNSGFMSEHITADSIEPLTKSLLYGTYKDVLKGAGLMNLLEFGRSVHAEMAAITTAARLGLSVKGSTLYSTTFPCHMCARHIVASGIKDVVYVEPYPKSKAKKLHKDSIDVNGTTTEDGGYVRFRPYQGIAPRQYPTIFMAGDLRKNAEGRAISFSMTEGRLRWQRFNNTYTQIESYIIKNLLPDMQRRVLMAAQTTEVKNGRKAIRGAGSPSTRISRKKDSGNVKKRPKS